MVQPNQPVIERMAMVQRPLYNLPLELRELRSWLQKHPLSQHSENRLVLLPGPSEDHYFLEITTIMKNLQMVLPVNN